MAVPATAIHAFRGRLSSPSHRSTMISLSKSPRPGVGKDTLALITDTAKLRHLDLGRTDRDQVMRQIDRGDVVASCDVNGRLVMVHLVRDGERPRQLELARRAANDMCTRLNAVHAE